MAVCNGAQIVLLFVGVVCPTFCKLLTVSKTRAFCLTILKLRCRPSIAILYYYIKYLFSVTAILLLFCCLFQFPNTYSNFRYGFGVFLNALSVTFLLFLYLT